MKHYAWYALLIAAGLVQVQAAQEDEAEVAAAPVGEVEGAGAVGEAEVAAAPGEDAAPPAAVERADAVGEVEGADADRGAVKEESKKKNKGKKQGKKQGKKHGKRRIKGHKGKRHGSKRKGRIQVIPTQPRSLEVLRARKDGCGMSGSSAMNMETEMMAPAASSCATGACPAA